MERQCGVGVGGEVSPREAVAFVWLGELTAGNLELEWGSVGALGSVNKLFTNE